MAVNLLDTSKGLPSGFDARVARQHFMYHSFREGDPAHLVMAVILEPDPESGIEVDANGYYAQYYRLGNAATEAFRTSHDGVNPIEITDDTSEEDTEAPYLVNFGAKSMRVSANSSFADFNGHVVALPVDIEISERGDYLLGGRFHWERLPQMERPGLQDDGENKKRDILVPVSCSQPPTGEVNEAPEPKTKPAAKKRPAKKATPAKKAAPAKRKKKAGAAKPAVDLKKVVAGVIKDYLETLGDDGYEAPLSALPKVVMEKVQGKDAGPAVQMLTAEFLASRDEFAYDPEDVSVFLPADDE